jgi:endonuclease/exonuclease/phosphatase family metal-dependent hydrolase
MKRCSYTPLAWCAVLLFCLTACRTGRNYPEAHGPRYSDADSIVVREATADTASIRIATFNIEYARHIDSAIALIARDSGLRDASILLLQEMTAESTRRIARSLGMHFVYYPTIYHRRVKQDVGNAVLSRWRIVEDAKLILPHRSRYAGTQRVATAATLCVGAHLLRVYSTHLGTPMDIAAGARRDQLRAIIDDAARYESVVIAGDMNQGDLGDVAQGAGFAWPTREGPRTTRLGRWDHIFVRGLRVDTARTGTAPNAGVSDHRPVWTTVTFKQP